MFLGFVRRAVKLLCLVSADTPEDQFFSMPQIHPWQGRDPGFFTPLRSLLIPARELQDTGCSCQNPAHFSCMFQARPCCVAFPFLAGTDSDSFPRPKPERCPCAAALGCKTRMSQPRPLEEGQLEGVIYTVSLRGIASL